MPSTTYYNRKCERKKESVSKREDVKGKGGKIRERERERDRGSESATNCGEKVRERER